MKNEYWVEYRDVTLTHPLYIFEYFSKEKNIFIYPLDEIWELTKKGDEILTNKQYFNLSRKLEDWEVVKYKLLGYI